jgi:hypothetical protein
MLLASVGSVTPAHAQSADCPPPDPYSGAQSCPDPPKCTLDPEVVADGRQMHVQASGFGPGDELTGVYDGEVVFKVRTEDGTLDITFDIPERPPGEYALIVSGSPSGQECDPPFRVAAKTEVQGVTFTRTGGGEGTTASSGSSSSSGTSGGGVRVLGRTFARTGADVALLALAGLALVMAGWIIRRRTAGNRTA